MPALERMFKRLILALEDEEFVARLRELLSDDKSLVEMLSELELVTHAGQLAFIEQTPASIQAAILAAVRQNLEREEPKQMLFAWTAGYDWEMRLTESTSSEVSAGGITIQVKSRYPGDPHPGTG